MKTYKKIGLGLSAVLLFITLFIPAAPKQAAAAGPDLNLKFGDSKGKTITGSYNNSKFTFTQSVALVGVYGYTITTKNSAICSGGFRVDQATADKAAAGFATLVNANGMTYKPAGSNSCTNYPDQQIPIDAYNSSSSNPPPKSSSVDWSGAEGALNADGSQITVTFSDGKTAIFKDSNTGDSTYNYKPLSTSVGPMGGSIVSNWCDNTVYKDNGGDDTHGITLAGLPASSGTVNICYQNSATGPQISPSPFSLKINSAGYKGPATNTAPQQTQCEKNSGGWAFAWGVCPVLEAANGLSTALIDIFEDNLNFNVSQLGTSTDPNSGNYKIHQSWSILKDIASGMVIIIMLIMVLSQAASFGPFDAYTIRKMLPRLVAAVILMQISWPLFNFVIKLVNDLASGIADVMYLPFGGPGQMDLWHLLAKAKLSNGLLFTMDWAAIIVFGVLGVAYLFTMLGFALTAIIALFFGVLTLIFRKVLIILLLIFSPVALLAWILPGTKKYWDMWWNNFIKVLFMFPIIVGIIAAGRIFAYVVGTQDNTQFLNLIFVMVGFFGPLFLLPKTYKWGGQAMQMAGNGIMKASSKVNERPKKFLDTRQEGWRRERQRNTASRIAQLEKGERTGFKKFTSAIRGDQLKAGYWDPTLGLPGSRRRREQIANYVAAGEKAGAEEGEAVGKLLDNELRGMSAGDAGDLLLEKLSHAKTGAEAYVYLDRIARYKLTGHLKIAREMVEGRTGQLLDDQGNVKKSFEGWTKDMQNKMGQWNIYANGGLYDTFKGLDVQLLRRDNAPGGFIKEVAPGVFGVDVSDEVLAGQTLDGWRDFMADARNNGQEALALETANRILHSEVGHRLDNKVRAYLGATPGIIPPSPVGGGAAVAGGNVVMPPVAAPVGGPGPAPAPAPAPATRPAPGEGAFVPNGELNVPHASPEGRVISANASDIDNFVTTSGGWGSLSDGDLYNIYHFRTGEHKAQAARELRNRGIL